MHPQLFIVPPAHAAPSGGNLYNEGLLAALHALTTPAGRLPKKPSRRVSRAEKISFFETACLQKQANRVLLQHPVSFARSSVESLEQLELGAYAGVWLDSLYLARAPLLRARLAKGTRLYLLAHAFPSDLARASERPTAELRRHEQTWLTAFDAALVPSQTMAESVAERAPSLPCYLVAPAVHALPSQRPPAESSPVSSLRVVIIANLVPNKGVLPFLEALEQVLAPTDRLALRVVGGFEADAEYARDCQALLARSPALRAHVQLLGVKPFRDVLDELARAHVLVSASRSESYGLAVADARASGCVILARDAGHVPRLVSPAAGGALFGDDTSLAQALLALCREPALLRARLLAAEAHALPLRSWHEAARDLLAQLAALAPGGP